MQTTMPSQEELARFIATVFLAMKKDGKSAHKKFLEEQPFLYALAAGQLEKICNGPKEQREKFVAGLKRILENGATFS
jgi:hypothetical protein